ncbi:MAG TPA: ADOP family duplicated permease [Vicinamibacterales bacterium]|nr:ADOP family duplicated permease [Vicinamibacterales bacterium]
MGGQLADVLRRPTAWLRFALTDVRIGFRQLRFAPAFSAGIVLTLALTMAADTLAFGFIDRLVLREPTGVRDARDLGRVFVTGATAQGSQFTTGVISYPQFEEFEHDIKDFTGITALFIDRVSLGGGTEARQVTASYVSPTYFDVLGVRPFLGRFIEARENEPPYGLPVAVISYELWRQQFGVARPAVGHNLLLDGHVYQIVGVAPRGFGGPDLSVSDVWLPLGRAGTALFGDAWDFNPNAFWLQAVGRLRPGATLSQAGLAASIAQRARHPETRAAMPISIRSIIGTSGPESPAADRVTMWLAVVASVLLAIACANVTSLYLARNVRRRAEIALRISLGGTSAHLARQVIAESMVLAALGGGIGVIVAEIVAGLIKTTLLSDAPWAPTGIDALQVIWAGALICLTGLLTAAAPAVSAARRRNLTSCLTGNPASVPFARFELRSILLVLQTALALCLLVTAGLFVRSFLRASSIDLGFDAQHLLLASVDLRDLGYSRPAADEFLSRAVKQLRLVSGVERVSVGQTVPFVSGVVVHIHVPGLDSVPSIGADGPYINGVTSDFFATLGMHVVAGRAFSQADRAGAERVAVVNATMAHALWPSVSPIGQCLQVRSDAAPCTRVIGVVADIHRDQLSEPASLQYFVPLEQQPDLSVDRTIFLRASGNSSAVILQVRHVLESLDAKLPFPDVQAFEGVIDAQVRPWRVAAVLLSIVGGLTILLAGVGLYSVISHNVAARRRELGIRIALGGLRRDVAWLVVAQGLRLTVLGLIAGLLVAFSIDHWVHPLLFEAPSHDVLPYVVVTAVLLGTSMAALALPARDATNVDPVDALRSQ